MSCVDGLWYYLVMRPSHTTSGKSADAINLAPTYLTEETALVEEAELITLLRAWGIVYLTGGLPEQPLTARAEERKSAPTFLLRLVRCNNVRVRDATISLLLLHPELAKAMQIAIQQSSSEDGETLT